MSFQRGARQMFRDCKNTQSKWLHSYRKEVRNTDGRKRRKSAYEKGKISEVKNPFVSSCLLLLFFWFVFFSDEYGNTIPDAQIDQLSQSVQSLQKESKALKAEIASLRSERETLTTQLANHQATSSALNAQVRRLFRLGGGGKFPRSEC